MTRRLSLLCAASLLACAPTLDWREVKPQGSGASALFPCSPASESRAVALAGATVEMIVWACSAGGATWALLHADVVDPARVSAALVELRRAAARNVDAAARSGEPVAIEGMTPNPEARSVRLDGKRPDGGRLVMQAAIFAHGTRVFQASVVGARPEAAAVETFFENLKVGS